MPDVLFEKRDGKIAWITLNRPDSLNAMGGELMPLLAGHLQDCLNDETVRCIVLTGAGRAFCAGGDVKAMASGGAVIGSENDGQQRSFASDFYRGTELLRQMQRATSGMLHLIPKPTIAMVNGHAVGAGLSLALACDIRIASDQAKLGTVFRNVGFSGDFGGSWFLPRLVGMERARRLYLTGEILTAEEAYRIGMVSQVAPHEKLEEETMALAGQIANGPTMAFGRMKENLNRSWANDLLTHLDQEALNMRLSGTTNDHKEAAMAFVQKRQPVFSGQ